MDDHFDIAHVFEIGKFDITRLTCIIRSPFLGNEIVESRPDMNIKVAAYMQ